MSTLGHPDWLVRFCACCCQCLTSVCKASRTAWASCQLLVDKISIRWANKTAASRWTITWCCKSSTVFTTSANCTFKPAKGSRDRGAPALAASRCQAKASAMFSRKLPSKVRARSAHSAAKASCARALLISSSFSLRILAAPLSREDNSLKMSCICSGDGSVKSHSRKRAMRSPRP